MNTTTNSINQNGCSVCEKGQEKYVKCVLGAFHGKTYYQYDYRHTDGELFSTLQETLALCREKRDKWLNEKETKKETKKQSVFIKCTIVHAQAKALLIQDFKNYSIWQATAIEENL